MISTITTPVSGYRQVPDWREAVPVLRGDMISLRELEPGDAAALMSLLTTPEVARFISPPPRSLDGFERFIAWARRERTLGNYVCFAVVPHGSDTAIGLFQIRRLEHDFSTAEWGFALGSGFWGCGVFADGAQLLLDFAFNTIGVRRLEARAAVANGRGNGALRKMGAVQEAVLRKAFLWNDRYVDQMLWSIVDVDWRMARYAGAATSAYVH